MDKIKRASLILDVLSDPTRLTVVYLLGERERNVGELATEIGTSQAALSHHLALMRHGGYVVPQRNGKFNVHGLTDLGRKALSVVTALMHPKSEPTPAKPGKTKRVASKAKTRRAVRGKTKEVPGAVESD